MAGLAFIWIIGAKALTDNLLNGLHETYYKMKLLNEYDVSAATSLS